jgi:ERCC4-type nuclease
MYVGDYYVKNFAKKDKLTQELIPYKKYDQYFATDFLSAANMKKWCDTAPRNEVKEYIINTFKGRMLSKSLSGSPPSTYLQTAGLPDIDMCKMVFGSYNEACTQFGMLPMLSRQLPNEFHQNYKDTRIFVDTREQNPLIFKNSEKLKLDVGDYAVMGENFDYTFVDRKSYQDFCSTVTMGYKRFIKEIERCKSLDSFLFIVVEAAFDGMEEENKGSYKKFKLDYVFHQMREIQSSYSDCCQFIFSGSRDDSIELIPKILVLGKKLWQVDLQYFWDKHIKENGLGNRKTKTKKRIQKYKPVITGKRGVFG